MSWLERHQYLVLAAVLGALILGMLVRSRGGSGPDLVFRPEVELADGTPIKVQVAGAIQRPGVYELASGDRLADALSLAGGPAEGASVDELNLARRLRDGEKVTIPGRVSAVLGPTSRSIAPGDRLDLNLATMQQLDDLPGIGEALARRIVDSRRVDGPFKDARDLVARNVLPAATYDRIRDMVFTGPP